MNYYWYCENCGYTGRKVFPSKMAAAKGGDQHRKRKCFPEAICKKPKISLYSTTQDKVPVD